MTKTEIDAMKAQRIDLITENRKYKRKIKVNAQDARSLSSKIHNAEEKRLNDFQKMIDNISKEDKKTIHDLSNMTDGDFSIKSIASFAGAATKARINKKYLGHFSGDVTNPRFPNLCHEKETIIKRMAEIDEKGHIIPNTEQDVKFHTNYYFTK